MDKVFKRNYVYIHLCEFKNLNTNINTHSEAWSLNVEPHRGNDDRKPKPLEIGCDREAPAAKVRSQP